MTEAEIFDKIIGIAEPLQEIHLQDEIANCEDLDSLALFNIVVSFKQEGIVTSLQELAKCDTVADLVTLLFNKQH